MIRLQKILSAAGVASRRASEQLLAEGRVSVNGQTVRELGTKADPSRDDIRVDGRRIRTDLRQRYILLYNRAATSPRGTIRKAAPRSSICSGGRRATSTPSAVSTTTARACC